MSSLSQSILILKSSADYIENEFGVKKLGIFGSIARQEDNDNSDIDIFVDMPPKALKIVGLKLYLQQLLGRTVDIVRSRSRLDSVLKNEIARDGITIFEK